MSSGELLVERVDGVGRIRLNRPRQINALTVPMMRTLLRVLEEGMVMPQERLELAYLFWQVRHQ